jgi:RNA polymerase sigma-70 factor (ECF subfamily)
VIREPFGRRRPDIPRPEKELIARARAGDMDAFEELASAHADRLFAVLLRLLGHRADAEDAAQEVMLRAWRGLGRFEGHSRFSTWLYRIAVNEASRSLEKTSRRPVSVSIDGDAVEIPAASRGEPSRRAEQAELGAALRAALAGLPPAYRTAIVLRDVEGLSTQQAAEIVGIGQAAFKSRLHQARLRVRKAIGDEALLGARGQAGERPRRPPETGA